MRLAEQLQPPATPAWQVELDEARQYRIERAYNDAFDAAMSGQDDAFWADCHQSIYDAVREAMSDDTMSAEWFRAKVSMAVRLEAERYAAAVSEDTD